MKIVFSFLAAIPLLASCTHINAPGTKRIVLKPEICQLDNIPLQPGKIPTADQIAKDAYCTKSLLSKVAPQGTVTIFGSARAKKGMDRYDITEEFAYIWSLAYGDQFPIMTGGGTGIMEAGNRGAFRAKRNSIGIGTFFRGGQETPNRFTSHSYMGYSFAQREADLVDYSAAIIVAPGGFGTEWEVFESLSKMQTRKKTPVPLVLLGPDKYWKSFKVRIEALNQFGTISPEDKKLIYHARTAEQAFKFVESQMALQNKNKASR